MFTGSKLCLGCNGSAVIFAAVTVILLNSVKMLSSLKGFFCFNPLGVTPIKIQMPALSPTMEEGNIVKWLKKEGKEIRFFQLSSLYW